MVDFNKRAKHLQNAREAKTQRRLEETDPDYSRDVLHEANWEGLSDSEEESDVEISEPEDNISDERKDLFESLISAAKTEWSHGVDNTKFLYQRGPTLSLNVKTAAFVQHDVILLMLRRPIDNH